MALTLHRMAVLFRSGGSKEIVHKNSNFNRPSDSRFLGAIRLFSLTWNQLWAHNQSKDISQPISSYRNNLYHGCAFEALSAHTWAWGPVSLCEKIKALSVFEGITYMRSRAFKICKTDHRAAHQSCYSREQNNCLASHRYLPSRFFECPADLLITW